MTNTERLRQMTKKIDVKIEGGLKQMYQDPYRGNKLIRELQQEVRDTRRYAAAALNGWKLGNDIVGPMQRLAIFLGGDTT